MQNGAYHARPRLLRSPRSLLLGALVAALIGSSAALAGYRGSGANGCGQFKTSVEEAQNGDALTPMYDEGQGRNSEGATIAANIIVEGGWSPPPSCPEPEPLFENAAAMLGAGFTYGGPGDRAALDHPGGPEPIVTIAPAVTSLLIYATDFHIGQDQTVNGGGLFGTGLSNAVLRFEQVGFISDPNGSLSEASVSGNGGGLSLDVNNGSRVTIADSQFTDLEANNGGGFDITVRGGSHVTLRNIQVTGNDATGGQGGGGRIIIHSGYVTITDSLFSGNSADDGGALRIERASGATGPAEVWIVNTRFVNNDASFNDDISASGFGSNLHVLDEPVAIPLVIDGETPGAQIERITRVGNNYSVEFRAVGFTPAINGQHLHFFFDTTPPDQAGVPAPLTWFVYAGSSPFNLWGVDDRPPGATKMCVLVANANHSAIQGTGNCLRLP